jgi:hypothetical protein
LGTLFVIFMLSSPFVAVFGIGIPLGLNAAMFTQWLRDDGSRAESPAAKVAAPQMRN